MQRDGSSSNRLVFYLRQDQLATAANSRYNIDGTDVLGRSGKGLDLGLQHRL